MDHRHLNPATIAVSSGRPARIAGNDVNEPVHFTSTQYSQGEPDFTSTFYARYGNASWNGLEDVVAELEGGRYGLAFASGMAAISAVMSELLPDGGTIVLPSHVYLAAATLARQFADQHAVTIRAVDIADTDEVTEALPGADLLWIESPTNPMLEIADVPALAAAAHSHGVRVVADNTFATPLGCNPLRHGADVVVHSATKYLAGHSDVVLGIAVMNDEELFARVRLRRSIHGGIPGPMEAFLALRGVRTLALRVSAAQANATELAARLAAHPAVVTVRHPSLPTDPGHARATAQLNGYGAIIGIQLGSAQRADDFIAALQLWVPGTSLGGVESLVERRRRLPAESVSVPPDYVRLAVGIEDVEDLWADLEQALAGLD